MEDGVQLGVHQPLVVSVKPHHLFHLHLSAPLIGPPTAIDGGVPSSCPSPIVHTEGEALVVVRGCDGLVLEGGEIATDAQRRTEGRIKCRAIRHQNAIKEGFQWAIRLTFDLVEDVGRVHSAIGRAG